MHWGGRDSFLESYCFLFFFFEISNILREVLCDSANGCSFSDSLAVINLHLVGDCRWQWLLLWHSNSDVLFPSPLLRLLIRIFLKAESLLPHLIICSVIYLHSVDFIAVDVSFLAVRSPSGWFPSLSAHPVGSELL